MRNLSLLVALVPVIAPAQWSTSVSEATTLFLSGGPQVQPKVSFFGNRAVITNFDNSAGGYDVYARVTDFGFLAPALPTLVADRTFSSTQDYDLDGHALIYRDNSSGTQGITVSLLNSDGTVANSRFWPGSQNQPKVAVLENGTIACGWSETGGFRIQIVDGTTLADASPSIFETETGHGLTLSDLATGENDRVIAMWVRTFTTSFLSAKWLYAQKYDSAGARLWNGGLPLDVYAPTGAPYGAQGGSIQNGTFPTITPDYEGGFVTTFYETGGPRNAYLQHIQGNGHPKFAPNKTGISILETDASKIRIGSTVSYDHWHQRYYVATTDSNANPQGNYTVSAQCITPDGTRLWGPNGTLVMPDNGFQKSFVRTQFTPYGLQVFGLDATGALSDTVFLASLDQAGAVVYGGTLAPEFLYTDTTTDKGRLDMGWLPTGDTVVVWQDGNEVLGQKLLNTNEVGNWETRNIALNLSSVTGHASPFKFDTIVWTVEVSSPTETRTEYVRAVNGVATVPVYNTTGPVNIRVKAAGYLATSVLGVGSTATAAMRAGDVDDDNEVGSSDFSLLSAGFLSTPGTTGWNSFADFDGDNEIGSSDLSALSAHFLLSGD